MSSEQLSPILDRFLFLPESHNSLRLWQELCYTFAFLFVLSAGSFISVPPFILKSSRSFILLKHCFGWVTSPAQTHSSLLRTVSKALQDVTYPSPPTPGHLCILCLHITCIPTSPPELPLHLAVHLVYHRT